MHPLVDFEKSVIPNILINPTNIERALLLPRRAYEWIRFDSNNACNIRCAYCSPTLKGRRGDDRLISTEQFKRFIKSCVSSTACFQLGCTQEPTYDKRFEEFTLLGRELVNPTTSFRVQTNGIMLDQYDPDIFNVARVDFLTVSIDTLSATLHAKLRSGADLGKIISNIALVKSRCPNLKIGFTCVVTTENIESLDDMVKFAIGFGVYHIEFREVLLPEVGTYNNEKVKNLRLASGELNLLMERLKKFEHKIQLFYVPAPYQQEQQVSIPSLVKQNREYTSDETLEASI